jgi:signal transduction histidine kinase
VDDDSANRVVMKHNLGGEFNLILADSGAAALEILARQEVAVLLADQRMPGMTGVDLAERALNLYPSIVRVIVTAYSDLEATIDAINRARVSRFIKKPWTREELVAVARESVRTYHNERLIDHMQQRLLEADQVTSVAVMASAIAHDLRQPLAYIEPTLEVLANDARVLLDGYARLSSDEARERLRAIHDGLGDIEHGVQKFKIVSDTLLKSLRSQKVKPQLFDLCQVVEGVVGISHSNIIRRARLDVDLWPEQVLVLGQEGKVIQLVMNLLVNAAQAFKEKTPMRNQVTVRLRAADEAATLEVEDNGCGIPHERLDDIFTPFFSTKETTGTGLGLPICKQIVEGMGGGIRVYSTPGKGTRFVVQLPRVPPGTQSSPAEAT